MWTRPTASRELVYQPAANCILSYSSSETRGTNLPELPIVTRRCCTSCGQVLDETTFSAEVTFTKGAGGISTADGQFVSDVAASRGLGRISGGRSYGYQVQNLYSADQLKL